MRKTAGVKFFLQLIVVRTRRRICRKEVSRKEGGEVSCGSHSATSRLQPKVYTAVIAFADPLSRIEDRDTRDCAR